MTMANVKTLREEIHDLMEMNNLTSDYLGVDITDYILFNVLNKSKYFNHRDTFKNFDLAYLDKYKTFTLSHFACEWHRSDAYSSKILWNKGKEFVNDIIVAGDDSMSLDQDSYYSSGYQSNVNIFVSQDKLDALLKLSNYIKEQLDYSKNHDDKFMPLVINQFEEDLYKSLFFNSYFKVKNNGDDKLFTWSGRNLYGEKIVNESDCELLKVIQFILNHPSVQSLSNDNKIVLDKLKNSGCKNIAIQETLINMTIEQLVQEYDVRFEQIQQHQQLKFEILDFSKQDVIHNIPNDGSIAITQKVSGNDLSSKFKEKYDLYKYLHHEYFDVDKEIGLCIDKKRKNNYLQLLNDIYGISYLKYNNFQYQDFEYDKIFIVLKNEFDDMLGFLALGRNKNDADINLFKINTISIKHQFRGLNLTDELYLFAEKLAKENNFIILRDTYSLSDDGRQFLNKKLEKYADKLDHFITVKGYDYSVSLYSLLYKEGMDKIDTEKFSEINHIYKTMIESNEEKLSLFNQYLLKENIGHVNDVDISIVKSIAYHDSLGLNSDEVKNNKKHKLR